MKVKKVSHSVVSDSLGHDMLLCPWNSPGKNTGVGCHYLFQEIFPTRGLNPCLLHCRQILYHLSHQASVVIDALNLNDSVHILLTTLSHMAIPNFKELGNSNLLCAWKSQSVSCSVASISLRPPGL